MRQCILSKPKWYEKLFYIFSKSVDSEKYNTFFIIHKKNPIDLAGFSYN